MDLFTGLPQAPVPPPAFFLLFLWALVWQALALWRAAKNDQRNWFVALLIIQTAGILDIIYLFHFAKKKMTLEELKGFVTKFNK